MIFYIYNSDLYHHGIKGMKWGIRRFQNKDGTLTEAGKKKANGHTKQDNLSNNRKKTVKKIAIGAAIIGGTALTVYGRKKIKDLRPDLIKKAKKTVDEVQSVTSSPVDISKTKIPSKDDMRKAMANLNELKAIGQKSSNTIKSISFNDDYTQSLLDRNRKLLWR